MARGRNRPFIRGLARGPRRESQWLELAPNRVTLAVANTAVLMNSLTVAEKALRPFTIVRTRGLLYAESDQSAANEFWHVAYGMAVVSDQAEVIGVTAIPTPQTDRESDLWLVYEEIANDFLFGSGVGFDGAAGRTKDFDSKGMRKVEEGQDVVWVSESSVLSGGVIAMSAGRVLIKLH